MTVSNVGKKLLNEIFSTSLKAPNGVNALRFRADNEQFLSEIDQLERLGYLERKNDRYFLRPLAIAQLAKENPDASSMVHMCSLVFALLRGMYKDNPGQKINIPDIAKNTSLSEDDARLALEIIIQTPILGSYTSDLTKEDAFIAPSESVLRFKSFEALLQQMEEWADRHDNQYREHRDIPHTNQKHPVEQKIQLPVASSKVNWEAIKDEFGVTKRSFGGKINFVLDSYKRETIFRDAEHAFVLASLGFPKPAVILAGGIIEELLRLYLEYKNILPQSDNFDGYIRTCEQNGLLKSGISRLSDSVRHFRNLVHLSKEENKKYALSKATAKGAVASIFTIVNDF